MTIDEYRTFVEWAMQLRRKVRSEIVAFLGDEPAELRLLAADFGMMLEAQRTTQLAHILGVSYRIYAEGEEANNTKEAEGIVAEIMREEEPDWDEKLKQANERITKEREAAMGAVPMVTVDNTGTLPVEEVLAKFDADSERRAAEALGAAFDGAGRDV